MEQDEKKTDTEREVAQKILEDATKSLDIAIYKTDMLGIKVAKEMLEAAKRRFGKINIDKNEQKLISTQIAQKQKSDLTKLANNVKKRR